MKIQDRNRPKKDFMDDETEISGAQPVLIKLPKGDIKLARLVVGGHKVSEVRLGRLRIPSMFYSD